MKNNQEYIYSFPNTSCTIRVIAHLQNNYQTYLNLVVVLNLLDCWLVKFNLKNAPPSQLKKNLQAFLSEMGSISYPSAKIRSVLDCLDLGKSPTEVMNRYQVVVVAYGKPETEEIEIFRDRVVDGLGYCPQNMA